MKVYLVLQHNYDEVRFFEPLCLSPAAAEAMVVRLEKTEPHDAAQPIEWRELEVDLAEVVAERDTLRSQLKISEQARVPAVAMAALFREQLEALVNHHRLDDETDCPKGCAHLANADKVLAQTVELAEAFVQHVRDDWERKVAEAIRGGGDPDALISKDFADAWAALMDKALKAERERSDKLRAALQDAAGELEYEEAALAVKRARDVLAECEAP
jgi:hypothetical protein